MKKMEGISINELQVFNNSEFGEIRTIQEDEVIWFCAADVCNALGFTNKRDALLRHCKKEGVVKHDTLTNGGRQQLNYINEPNLYRLIVHSRLPSAEKFEKWVFEEVLPTIRKTGNYAPA